MKSIVLAITTFTFIISCSSKKGGKQLAEDICECSKKANALPATNPNRAKAQNDCSLMQGEAWTKIKDDTKEADAFNEAIKKCAEEQIKASFNKK